MKKIQDKPLRYAEGEMRICILLLIAGGLVAQAPSDPRKEAALGVALAKDVGRHTTAIDSATATKYVEDLAGKLLNQSDHFAVVRDAIGGSTHEPLALPGGYLFISADLVLAARDESEFAGMLAHSMAHIALRHGARVAARGQIGNLATTPLIFMGGWTGNDRMLMPIGLAAQQRENEREADTTAVGLLTTAGFDPEGFLRYLRRVQPAEALPHSMLPPLTERLAAMEEAIRRVATKSYPPPSAAFDRIQDEVRNLVPPDRPPSLRAR